MRGILLAAGKGTRLEQGAGDRAKCLLKLGDLTIIERQIFYLRQSGIEDIVVVVGFQAQQVRQVCGTGIQYIENPIYQETNSLYSLWLARHLFSDGFVVMNSDVLFHPQLLLDLLTARYEDALLVGYREENSYGEEEMKIKIRRGQVIEISKEVNPNYADGENVGIVKFGASGARILTDQLDTLIKDGGLHSWAPRAFLEFAKIRPLHAIGTRGYPWVEIDFPADYERALKVILPQLPILPQKAVQAIAALSEKGRGLSGSDETESNYRPGTRD
jgi:choline kinase